jgi:hypothetical protein
MNLFSEFSLNLDKIVKIQIFLKDTDPRIRDLEFGSGSPGVQLITDPPDPVHCF